MSERQAEDLRWDDAWLRRIAGALVRDPHLSEDLVQDVWLASLERGGGSSRAWLGGVLRNKTFAVFRRDARRRAREGDLPQRDAAPPPDEVLEQLQLRERLAAALGALEEPFRTAVYLHFVVGCSVRETAARTGVSPSTANERVQVGLARLRTRLDRSFGGDRRAWLAPLLPWARPSAPLLPLPTLPLVMLACISTATVVAVLSGALSLSPSSPSLPRGPESIASATSAPGSAIAAPTRAARSASSPTVGGPTTEPAAPLATARVVGTFTRPDGSPASGAAWALEASLNLAGGGTGLPEGWTDPSGALDATGRLDVTFDTDPGLSFRLAVDCEGLVRASWLWLPLQAGQVVDLGTVELRAAGSIAGTVVGPDGAPLTERRWFAYAREANVLPDLGLQAAGAGPIATLEDATFEIGRLPEGPVNLRLYDKQLGWVQGPTVDVVAGATTHADVVVGGLAEAADTVALDVQMGPVRALPGPACEHVWLETPSGELRIPRLEGGRYVFSDVGAGPHRVGVDDARFAPWSQDGVEAGARVRADLTGNATVRFHVENAGGGVLTNFAVDGKLEGVAFFPCTFAAASLEQPLDGGVLTGLVPGDYTFTVGADGVSATAAVSALAAGEVRDVTVVLDSARIVHGQVSFPDGLPAADRIVRLVTPAVVDDSPDSMVLDATTIAFGDTSKARRELARTTTAEDGTFALPTPADAMVLVVVGAGSEPHAESDPFAGSEPPAEVHLVVERGAWLDVSVEVPAGMATPMWSLVFVRSDEPRAGVDPAPRAFATDRGHFFLGPIAAGPGTLVLWRSGNGSTVLEQLLEDGDVLATRTLADGEARTESFAFPGEAPVAVSFDLSGVVPEAETVAVALARASGATAALVNGPAGSVGPAIVEPGEYTAWCAGSDWVARVPAVAIPAGSPPTVLLAPDLTAQTVRFLLADGEPLVDGSVVAESLPSGFEAPTFRTDGEGWAEVRLGEGTYGLRIDTLDPERAFLRAQVAWPLAPGESTVTFE